MPINSSFSSAVAFTPFFANSSYLSSNTCPDFASLFACCAASTEVCIWSSSLLIKFFNDCVKSDTKPAAPLKTGLKTSAITFSNCSVLSAKFDKVPPSVLLIASIDPATPCNPPNAIIACLIDSLFLSTTTV